MFFSVNVKAQKKPARNEGAIIKGTFSAITEMSLNLHRSISPQTHPSFDAETSPVMVVDLLPLNYLPLYNQPGKFKSC